MSKLAHAVRACRNGVPRVHVIDGRVEEGLLAEVFSNDGIGTLVHTNEYQAIRRAQRKDARALYGLIQGGIENDELVRRTLAEIERTRTLTKIPPQLTQRGLPAGRPPIRHAHPNSRTILTD